MRAGTVLIVVGAVVAAVGLVVRFAPWAVSWFGRLPGDIRIETDTTRVYLPITSMILVSLGVSAVLWMIARVRG